MAAKYSRSIVVDSAKVAADQTNFPVMIAGTFPEFKSAANGGHISSTDPHQPFDLQFWADPAFTTKLDWEVSYWDPSTGDLECFIRIPSLSSSADTTIYATYGNTSIITDQSNATGVWGPAGYLGVYHMGYSPDSTAAIDSSGNNYNGTALKGAATNHPDSFNAVATSCDAAITAPQSIELPGLFGGPSEITVELWAKVTAEGYYGSALIDMGGYVSITGGTSQSASVFGFKDSAGNWTSYNYWGGIADNQWYHLAWSVKPGSQVGYVNGAQGVAGSDANGISWSGSSSDQNTYLGIQANGGTGEAMSGYIDEVRISSVARSASWVATQYRNMTDSAFISMGAEQSASTSHAWTLTFSDGITPTDTIQRSIGKGVADTTSIGDSIIKAFAFVRFDATPVSDRIWKGTTRSSVDVIPVSDSIRKATTKGFAEQATITEAITKATSKAFSDAFIAADSIRRAIAKSFREAVSPSDSIRKAIGKRFVDTASIVDVFTYTTSMVVVAVRRFIARLAQRSWMAETKQRSFIAEVKQRMFTVGEEMISTTKDPDEVSDFFVDFSDYIVAPDTIKSSKWVVPAPMTLVQSSNTTTSCTGRLAGGITGKNYQVAAEATLASGQVLVQRFRITIGPE